MIYENEKLLKIPYLGDSADVISGIQNNCSATNLVVSFLRKRNLFNSSDQLMANIYSDGTEDKMQSF